MYSVCIKMDDDGSGLACQCSSVNSWRKKSFVIIPNIVISFLINAISFLTQIYHWGLFYASRMSQCHMTVCRPRQLREFFSSALLGALTLLQPTDISVYFQRKCSGLLLLIFSPAAVFSMSNLTQAFLYTGIYLEPCHNFRQIISAQSLDIEN